MILFKKPSKKLLLLHLLPLILGCLIGGIVAMQAGQDQNWDLQNYHYYVPYALIHHEEGLNFAVSGIQTYINPLPDIVSYVLIDHFKPIVASTVLGAIQGLNIWLVYEIAGLVLRKLLKGGRLYGLSFAIAVVSFFGAGNLGEVGDTMTDNLASLFVLLSVLLILLAHRYKRNYSNTQLLLVKLAAYGVIGLSFGLKLTNAPFVVGLLMLEFFNYSHFWAFVKNCVYDIGAIIVGFAITGGAWTYYLVKNYQNPLFPYYNAIFHSKYADNVSFVDSRWFPHGILHKVFFPFFFLFHPTEVAEIKFTDPRFALVFTALVSMGAYVLIARFSKRLPRPKLHKEVLMLAVFMAVSYLLWEKQFAIYRYLIPLEFLSVLMIVATLWTLIPKPKVAAGLSVLLFLALFLVTRPMDWGRISWQPSFFGIQVPTHFLAKDSTVLLGGPQPLSFLIPFFPLHTPFLRIGEAVVFSPADQNLVRSRIASASKKGATFYGIETAATSAAERQNFKQFGFVNDTCKPIPSYVGTYFNGNPNYYKLCKLRRVTS